MNLRYFVSGSSMVLIGWLALTFFHEVPTQRYPRLERPRGGAAPETTHATPAPAAGAEENPIVHVSVSP